MSNMSYCRFRNTLNDLQDCYEHIGEDEENELSEEEFKAKRNLIDLCVDIALEEGYQVQRDVIEED